LVFVHATGLGLGSPPNTQAASGPPGRAFLVHGMAVGQALQVTLAAGTAQRLRSACPGYDLSTTGQPPSAMADAGSGRLSN
jgi:hypothetical protein